MASGLSGLSSGFDWKNYISKMMSLQRVPQDKMQSEQDTNLKNITHLEGIKTLLESLQDTAKELKKGTSDYYDRTVSFGLGEDDTFFSAKADGTTPLGEYAFEAVRLATATKISGAAVGSALSDASRTLANLNIATPITAGTFTVGGARVEIETTDTLTEVFDKISTATSGAITATLSADKMVLTANSGQRITVGASSDTSNFLTAMKLYSDSGTTPAASIQSAGNLGAVNVNAMMSTSYNTGAMTGLVDGAGSVTINGVEIDFNVNSNSTRAFMNQINSSGAGVLVSFDPSTRKFSMTSNSTGAMDVSIEDPNGIFAQMGLTSGAGATKTFGLNGQFRVNGSAEVIESYSNTLTADVHGIPGLEVTMKDLGTDTLTVKHDSTAAQAMINEFITGYNKVRDKIEELTKIEVSDSDKITKGALYGNSEVESWLTKLRQIVFGSVDTGNDTISRLNSIGIDFNTDGQLEIAEMSDLTDFLEDNPNEVALLFNDSEDGVANKLSDYIDQILGNDGSYESQIQSLKDENKDLQTQIERMEVRLVAEEERMTSAFVAMEEAQAKIKQQGSLLNSILGI